MSKRETKHETVADLAKAVSYLEDVIRSLRSGSISVGNGSDKLVLNPHDQVKVKVEASQKPHKESISVRLSWQTAPEDESSESFEIGSPDGTPQSK